MAAFCGCCGAEVTGKAEACLVCGTPRHGMMRAGRMPAPDSGATATVEKLRLGDDVCGMVD
jgi:hypothetical protein